MMNWAPVKPSTRGPRLSGLPRSFNALVVAGVLLALLSFATRAHAQSHHALVVGIDRYDNLGPDKQLRNAVNDARAMGAALQKLGFAVETAENAGRLEINRLWARFLGRIEPGDVVALYFSGHGVEVGGSNFLVPRDAPRMNTGDEPVLRAELLGLDGLLDELRKKGPRVSLVILDACRNNPYTDARGRSIGSTRGLARVEPPRGTFVMYSAGAGQTALDRLSDADPNPNSVYTRSLLPLLAQPGLSLSQIARGVRARVRDLALEARHEQTPAYYDELIGDFYPAGPAPTGASGSPIAQKNAPSPPQASPAAEAWRAVQDTKSCAVLASFLQQFPTGTYANFARARQSEIGCGRTAAVAPTPTPAAPASQAPVTREFGRFENQLLRATVVQARAVTDERALVGKYRLLLSVRIENTGRQEFGLGLHPYPHHKVRFLGSGGDCQPVEITGLNEFYYSSDGGVYGFEKNQTTVSPGDHIIVGYVLGCRASFVGGNGTLTEQLWLVRGGRAQNVTLSFASIQVP